MNGLLIVIRLKVRILIFIIEFNERMCKNESNDFDRRLIYISDHFIWQLQFEAYVTKHVLMYPLFPKMD